MAQVTDTNVLTIEGLNGEHPLQQLFMNEVGAQCGICTPGIAVCAAHVVDRGLLANRDEAAARVAVRELLSGNICRCTGYQLIVDAVITAAREVGTRR